MIGQTLARVLAEAGFEAHLADDAVLLPSGLRLAATLLDNDELTAGELEDGRVVLSIRIVASHDGLFPQGLPEVQHAGGASAEEALASGLAAWARRTLVVLEDALRATVRDCDLMNLKLAAGEGEAVYQALFGPVIRFAERPAPTPEEEEPCSFCMTTRIQDALAGQLPGNAYAALRLMAGRDGDGFLVADCQLNGEPLAEAAARLMAYARAWPECGFEVREQYVILRPVPAASPS